MLTVNNVTAAVSTSVSILNDNVVVVGLCVSQSVKADGGAG